MMRTAINVLAAVAVMCAVCAADGPPTTTRAAARFVAVDVFVDAGETPLAAYQLEVTAKGGVAELAGVEGGDHAAFREPAFYDPAALRGGRVILAAFSTARGLPKGKTRVATLHVQITGDVEPTYVVKLTLAAGADGKKTAAAATVRRQMGDER